MQRSTAKRSLDSNADELDAKLELLQQLCLQDASDLQAPDNPHHRHRLSYVDERWIQAEYGWAMESAVTSTVSFFDEEEEDMDACMPHLYDPTLFSDPRVTSTLPTKPTTRVHQRAYSEKDKPLPALPRPSLVRRGVPDAPPPSPITTEVCLFRQLNSSSPPRSPLKTSFSASSLRTHTSSTTPRHTPPGSPCISSSTSRSPKANTFPRGPQASGTDAGQPTLPSARPSVGHRHATFPSITSTLELLEERASPEEKRMGVLVTGMPEVAGDTATNRSRSAGGSIGRSSGETVKSVLAGSSPMPKKAQRPVLPALTTSVSTPQLRSTIALNSARSSMSGSSFASRTTIVASVAPTTPATSVVSEFPSQGQPSAGGQSPENVSQPSSRWSLDSVASRPTSAHPMGDSPAGSGMPQTPASGRKRDRLMSFITRGRSGSLGKGTPPIPNPANAGVDNILPLPRSSVSREPPSATRIASPRPSLSAPTAPPLPMPTTFAPTTSTSTSMSTSTTSSAASSASSLQTPVSLDMQRHVLTTKSVHPYSSEMPTYVPEAYAAPVARPAMSGAGGALLPPFEYQDAREPYHRPPTPPTSPPPQPTLPLPSPGTPSASFLVSPQHRSQSIFSSLPFKKATKRRDKKLVITGVPLEDADDGRDTDWKASEKRRRYGNVVRWCEGFGEVRKIERKPDGTLHVYWRDWESADMVCRVHAQVYIKDVGRVSLAWQYIS